MTERQSLTRIKRNVYLLPLLQLCRRRDVFATAGCAVVASSGARRAPSQRRAACTRCGACAAGNGGVKEQREMRKQFAQRCGAVSGGGTSVVWESPRVVWVLT
jgi:hypothetical protein